MSEETEDKTQSNETKMFRNNLYSEFIRLKNVNIFSYSKH